MKFYRILLAVVLLAALPNMAAADSLQDNLRRHVERLCDPSLLGRKAGTSGERLAAGYLYDCLEEIGVSMLTGRDGDTFTIVCSDGSRIESANIVGILEGEDQNLREEYIVIGAHLDHLGSYSVNVDGVPQERIYPGACSNASGIASLIEAARILKDNAGLRRRSLVFVGFGAMEEQFAGSRYFASEGGFGQIANVKMMIDLDMLGRGGSTNQFEIYSPLQSGTLTSLINYVAANESVTTRPALHSGWVFPSDFLAFDQAGIPCVTFSTGTFREYRTTRDTPDMLLYDNLAAETVYIAAFSRSVACKVSLMENGSAVSGRLYALNECDVQPQFLRHDVRYFMDNWVYKYLKYPKKSVTENTEGFERTTNKRGEEILRAVVHVSFIIEADGNVSNVAVDRGANDALDDEALRVVEASPKWKPGEVDGRKVRTKIVIPVEYRLKKR